MFSPAVKNKRVEDESTSQGRVLLGTERCLFAMDMGHHLSDMLGFGELRAQIQSYYKLTGRYCFPIGKTFLQKMRTVRVHYGEWTLQD